MTPHPATRTPHYPEGSAIEQGYSPIPPVPEGTPHDMGQWGQLLRNRNMLALWASQVFEHIADGILYMVFVEFAARSDLGGAFGTSMWMFWMGVPVVLTGHMVGVFIDRWDRRRIMMMTNLSRGAIAGLMGFVMVNGWWVVWFYVLAALLSFVTQFFLPAKAALLPKIVSSSELLLANSMSNATMWIMILVGLAGGGWLVAQLDIGPSVMLAVFAYMISSFAASRIQVGSSSLRTPHSAPRTWQSPFARLWSEVREGFRIVKTGEDVAFVMRRSVLVLVVVGTVFIEMVSMTQGVLTQHGTTMKGIMALGYVVAALGLGVILGPVVIRAVHSRLNHASLIRLAYVGLGVTVLGLGMTNRLSVVLALSPVMGVAFSIIMIVADTTLQAKVPDQALGRIFAVTNMLRQAVFTVTTVVMGALDKFVGRGFQGVGGMEWEHVVFLTVGGSVLLYSGLAELFRQKNP